MKHKTISPIYANQLQYIRNSTSKYVREYKKISTVTIDVGNCWEHL